MPFTTSHDNIFGTVFAQKIKANVLEINTLKVLTAGGEITIEAGIIIPAHLTIEDLTVNGNTILGSDSTDTLLVNATSTFNNDVTLGSSNTDSLTINSTTIINGPLTIASLANLTVNGNTTLGDAAGDTLTVNATSTFVPSATFTGGLISNGVSSFTNNVTLGDAAGDTLTVNATSTFVPSVTFTGGLISNGVSSFTNSVTLGDAAGDTLTVNATSTFATLTTFSNGFNAANTVSFSGPVIFNETVQLGNNSVDAISFPGTATFTPKATFLGGTVTPNSTITGGYSYSGTVVAVVVGGSIVATLNGKVGHVQFGSIQVTNGLTQTITFTINNNCAGTNGLVSFYINSGINIAPYFYINSVTWTAGSSIIIDMVQSTAVGTFNVNVHILFISYN